MSLARKRHAAKVAAQAKKSSVSAAVFKDHLEEHMYIHGVTKGKTHQNKKMDITPAKEQAKGRVNVVVRGPGFLPFGADISEESGSMYVVVPVNDEDEAAGLRAIDEYVLNAATGPDSTWWPERVANGKKIPTRATVEEMETYSPLIRDGKFKDEAKTECYPPSIRLKIPYSKKTGKPAPWIRIVNHDLQVVSVDNLENKKFDVCVFELTFVWFNGPKFGIARNLKYLRLAEQTEDDPDQYDFLDGGSAPARSGDDGDDEEMAATATAAQNMDPNDDPTLAMLSAVPPPASAKTKETEASSSSSSSSSGKHGRDEKQKKKSAKRPKK